jgi:hypothetical protein
MLQSINPLWATLGKLVFKNNYFTYLDRIYKQTHGIAMGTNSAVHLANLYLAQLLDPIVVRNKSVLYYKRYIDDLLIVFRGNEHELLTFKQRLDVIHPKLTFTHYVSNSSINFLDLHIYHKEGKLEINTYFKAISKFAYLPPTSTHPKSVLKGMIIGELTRYFRTNSLENTLILTLELFKDRLLKRGYSYRYIKSIFTNFINKIGYEYHCKYHPTRVHQWLTFPAKSNLMPLSSQEVNNLFLTKDITPMKRPRPLDITNLPIMYDGDHISQYLHNYIKENYDILPLWTTLRPTYIMTPSIGRLLLRSDLSVEQIAYIKQHQR